MAKVAADVPMARNLPYFGNTSVSLLDAGRGGRITNLAATRLPAPNSHLISSGVSPNRLVMCMIDVGALDGRNLRFTPVGPESLPPNIGMAAGCIFRKSL